MEMIKRLIKEEDGATAIEYGLIAGLIAVVIIGATGRIGDSISTAFENVASALEDEIS